MDTKFIFVYNATSGFWSRKLDMAHKIVSPKTYACNLCNLTHGNFSEKEEWRNFKNQLQGITMEFLYKDKFIEQYPEKNNNFPIVFKQKGAHLEIFLTKKELKELDSVEALIAAFAFL